jgi:hypothetical protein
MQTFRTVLATLPRVPRQVTLRLAAGTAALMTAAALTGCSGGDETDLPTFSGAGGSSQPSATPTPTPLPDPIEAIGTALPKKGTELGDDKNSITVGRTVSGGGERDTVQIAYLAFWVERARALRVVHVDDAALAKVAVGDAAERVVLSVRELQGKKQHTEGGSTVNVVALKVAGSTATITDCFLDRSTDRDAEGNAVEAPDFAPVPITATLEQAGGAWRVNRVVPAKKSACQ